MTKDTALKLALEALEANFATWSAKTKAIPIIKEALAQPEQEPVAWLITDEKINSLQVDSIQRLIDRAKHAHMTDIKLRINGQDEWYEADWLKHLTRTTTPRREWVGLTDEERDHFEGLHLYAARNQVEAWIEGVPSFIDAIEAKLREKNT
jgi:hypothetical protein